MDWNEFVRDHALEVRDDHKEYEGYSEHFETLVRSQIRQAFRAGFERGYFEAMSTYQGASDEAYSAAESAKDEIRSAISDLEQALDTLDF